MSSDDVSTDTAWVSLGSNVGYRGRNLARLREALTDHGVFIASASPEMMTLPVGVTAQGDFHNQVIRLRSPVPWTPQRWLEQCVSAERAAGRRTTYRWGPRIADADILLLGADGDIQVHEPDLTVPHPELAHRPFEQQLLEAAGFKPATAGTGSA